MVPMSILPASATVILVCSYTAGVTTIHPTSCPSLSRSLRLRRLDLGHLTDRNVRHAICLRSVWCACQQRCFQREAAAIVDKMYLCPVDEVITFFPPCLPSGRSRYRVCLTAVFRPKDEWHLCKCRSFLTGSPFGSPTSRSRLWLDADQPMIPLQSRVKTPVQLYLALSVLLAVSAVLLKL